MTSAVSSAGQWSMGGCPASALEEGKAGWWVLQRAGLLRNTRDWV